MTAPASKHDMPCLKTVLSTIGKLEHGERHICSRVVSEDYVGGFPQCIVVSCAVFIIPKKPYWYHLLVSNQ